jgi:dienelactone hydrolase
MKYPKRISGLVILPITLTLLCLSCASCQSVSCNSAPVTEDSIIIDGNLYKPEGNGPFPAVVVLHGCAGIDYHFSADHDFDRPKGIRTYLGHVLRYDDKAAKDAKESARKFVDGHLLGK